MEVLSVKLRCQPWSPSPWSQRPEWPAEVSAELETKEVHSWQWRCRASTSLYLLHHVKFGENVHQQSNLSAGVLLPNPDSSRLRKIEKKKKSRIKKDVEKETVVPWDFQGLGTAFLQIVRTWTIVEAKSRQRQRGQMGSWWCEVRMSVVRGLEEKATWFWWLPLSKFCRALSATEAAPSPWEENAHGCSPGGLGAKNLPANQKTWVWSLCQEDSPGEEMETQSSTRLGKSHGQRNLADCSPWGHKQLDTTEQLSMGGLGPELRGGTPAHFYYWCHLRETGTFERRNASLPEGILQIV